jgi:hypothetical protein
MPNTHNSRLVSEEVHTDFYELPAIKPATRRTSIYTRIVIGMTSRFLTFAQGCPVGVGSYRHILHASLANAVRDCRWHYQQVSPLDLSDLTTPLSLVSCFSCDIPYIISQSHPRFLLRYAIRPRHSPPRTTITPQPCPAPVSSVPNTQATQITQAPQGTETANIKDRETRTAVRTPDLQFPRVSLRLAELRPLVTEEAIQRCYCTTHAFTNREI